QNELVRFLFTNYDDWVGILYNATEEGLTRILDQAGKDTFAELNLEGSFDLANPRSVSWIKENALKDTESYSDTIKEAISSKLQEGVAQGLSNEKIADSISGYFTD